MNNVEAEGVAELYFERIDKHHGLLRGIVSD
jgi:hypothetical protein